MVILIGNPDNSFATNLPYAERDLEAMKLYALEGLKVSPQNLHVFRNADTNAFDSIFGKGGLIDRDLRGRNLFVFISGHGVTLPGFDSSHFLPSNADPARAKQLYSVDDVKAALARARAQQASSGLDRRVFAMFDTCFSGQDRHRPGEQAYSGKAPPLVPRIEVPDEGAAFTLLSASNGIAYDDEDAKLGALTSGFLRAAAGLADHRRYDGNANNSLETLELRAYLNENVAALAGRAQSADLVGEQDLSLPIYAVPEFRSLQQSQNAKWMFDQAQSALRNLPSPLDYTNLDSLRAARLERDQILLPLRRFDRYCQRQDCGQDLISQREAIDRRLTRNLLEFEDQSKWLEETARNFTTRCQPYLAACRRFKTISPNYACIYQFEAESECRLLAPKQGPSDAELLAKATRSDHPDDWQACVDRCQLEVNQAVARQALERIQRQAEEEAIRLAEEAKAEEERKAAVRKRAEDQAKLDAKTATPSADEAASFAAQQEAEMRDARLWERALSRDSVSAYLAYERVCKLCSKIEESKSRRQALEATNEKRQAELLDLQIWTQVKNDPTPEALQLYLSSCQPVCAFQADAIAALSKSRYQLSHADLADRLADLNLRRLTKRDVERLQQALADRSCEVGAIDGQVGSKTRNALQDFIDVARKTAGYVQIAPDAQVLSQLESASDISCARSNGSQFRDCPDCPVMVVLPTGSFRMGSNDGEEDERPVHQVRIDKPIAMGRNEITLGEFRAFVTATGHSMPQSCWTFEDNEYQYRDGRSWLQPNFVQNNSHPVVCLTWADAQAYVTWLNRSVAGSPYRLPSEAEWEYAARAGSTSPYYWGTDSDHSRQCRYGNGTDTTTWNDGKTSWNNKATCSDGHAVETAKVRQFRPNDFGLYDMSGNAGEWVEDCYKESYQGAPSDQRPHTETNCERHVFRGGGWYSVPAELRSAERVWASTRFAGNDLGFRVVKELR